MPDHTSFIVAAFLVTGVVLAGAVLVTLLDYRAQLKALARLSGPARRPPFDASGQDDR